MRTLTQKQPAPSTSARSHTATPGLHHRADLIPHLQRTSGNQPVQPVLETHAEERRVRLTDTASPHFGHDFSQIPVHSPAPGAIQTELAINQPGDAYEHEAERIADQVMATAAHPLGGNAPPRIQRYTGQSSEQMEVVPASVGQALASPGSPLESTLRQDVERRFGHDFTRVRVHTGPAAEQSARDVNASAYAAGCHIAFARGRFTPETTEGRRLLAHELTHVLQQSAAGDSWVIRRAPGGGEPPPSTPSLPPASENLARLGELMSGWIPPEKQPLTTLSRAAAIEVKTGRRVYLIAVAGEGAGLPLDRSILRADEVLVPYTGEHAEIQTMRFAKKAGYRIMPGALDPSRAFCTNCAWWAIKENLAPPHGTVRVGQKIKPITSVTLSELSKNIPPKTLPGSGGELTAKGIAKREQRRLKSARERPPTIMPSAPVTTPMPPPTQSPMSAHEGTRMPPPHSSMSSHEPFRMPPPQSPMTALEGSRMPKREPPMLAHQGFRSSGPLSLTSESNLGSSVAVERARVPGGTFAGRMVKSLAVDTLVVAIVTTVLGLAWSWLTYEKNVESEEDRRLRKLLEDKVTPGVKRALEAHASEAVQMTTDRPEFPVYANVTVDLVKNWTESGIAGHPSDKVIVDASFVDLNVSFEKVSKEETRDSYHSFSNYYATSRVTYSVEIDFGETKAEHQWRRVLHDVAGIARRNLSAESVAEHVHWTGIELTAAEKRDDEERRKWGYPTLAEQRAYDERELWVLAYIEYTAVHGPDNQYSAALGYLDKIRRRPRPIPGQVLRGFPSR
jgi:Domain of unknown function (DUF4157)